MMRVTQQSVSMQVIEGLQRAFQRVAGAQEQVTSGRRINRLSDDPIGATRALRLRTFEDTLAQYRRNIDNSQAFLETADSVLNEVVEGLTRAAELTVQMANDIYSPVEKQATAKEIEQIFQQVLSLANTKVENRFLFAGFRNGTAPFAQGDKRVEYLGDNGEIEVQANPISTLTINLLGNELFQAAGNANGQGVFDVLQDLQAVLEGSVAPNRIELAVNLDDSVAAGSGFSPPDAVGSEALPSLWHGEADFATGLTVFDAKGEGHQLTVLFAKVGATTFNYRVVTASDEITGGTTGNLYQVAPQGVLEFNGDGSINLGASTIPDITIAGLANGADDIVFAGADFDFAGSTHLTAQSAVLSLAQTNTNGLQAQLGRIHAAIDHTLTFRAELGARLSSAKTAADAVTVLKDQTLGQRTLIEDADVLKAYSDFARFQHAFDAALQSASQVLRPSLLDFIR